MTENQVRAVAVFFYYVLPHELLALEACDKALVQIKKKQASKAEPDEVNIVSCCNQIAKDYLKKYGAGSGNLSQHNFSADLEKMSQAILQASTLSLGPWRQMLRENKTEDVFLLLWAHVLEFPIEAIAIATGHTRGTVLHRVAKIVDQLGSYLQPGAMAGAFDA